MNQSKTTKQGHSTDGVKITTGSPTSHEELGSHEATKIAPSDHPTETKPKTPADNQKPPSGDQPQNPKHADKEE